MGMSDGLLAAPRRTKIVLHQRRRILVFLIRSLTKNQLPIFEVPSFPAASFLISVNFLYGFAFTVVVRGLPRDVPSHLDLHCSAIRLMLKLD
jgi:hypothetical protein